MSEDGMPSSVITVGSREEVMRSWLESETRSLQCLEAQFRSASRAGKEREAARLYGELGARTMKYNQRAKEFNNE